MTATPRNGNGNGSVAGIFVSWAVLAIIAAMVASLVAGAIQLGSVQTYVAINTTKVEQLMGSNQALIERLARVESRQQINETRIGLLETKGVSKEEFEAWKQNRVQLLEQMQKAVDQSVSRNELMSLADKDKLMIESLRREIDQVDNSLKSRLQIAPGGPTVTLKP